MANRYFFHVTDGDQTLVDNKGIDLVSVVAARARAVRHGRLVIENLGAVIDITNSSGDSVSKIPLVLSGVDINKDVLTGLLGRAYFVEWLTTKLNLHPTSHVSAVLALDVDRLKDTNDAFGHIAGDEILKKIAKSLRSVSENPSSTIARLEGDKFAIAFTATDRGEAIKYAESIQKTLLEPLDFGGRLTEPRS